MKKIITITHEFGSGGWDIAKKVAQELQIPFYADEIIDKTAEESGFSIDYVKQNAEKKTQSFLYSLYMNSLPASDKIFLAQCEVIREIAEKSPEKGFIIAGSCAEYVLRENPRVFKIFIRASFDKRLEKVQTMKSIGKTSNGGTFEIKEHPATFLHRTDKRRVGYFNYFTSLKFGDANIYDLCLNSEEIGYDKCAEIIKNCVQ